MSKINELRAQRAKTWEQTKAFLDSHRNEKGILSAEDTQTYERMEQEIVDLGREIDRQERIDAMEREMNAPTATPLTAKPDNNKKDTKAGRASDAYKEAFWNQVRAKGGQAVADEVVHMAAIVELFVLKVLRAGVGGAAEQIGRASCRERV